jgi:hypothetical protein
MFLERRKKFVAARPSTRPARKFCARGRYALALAPPLLVSCTGRSSSCAGHALRPLPPPLPITPTLLLPLDTAMRTRPILLAGSPTPPAPGRLPTTVAAVATSPMPRPEQLFAALEQTHPGPITTTLWPRAQAPKKMTSVHGRVNSRCTSLEAKRELRFEALLLLVSRCLFYKKCPSASQARRHGFCPDVFKNDTARSEHHPPKCATAGNSPISPLAQAKGKPGSLPQGN